MVGRGRKAAPRGVALINALVVVAALSAVAVTLMQRAEQARQRLDDLFPADQAEMYLDAATWQVREVLRRTSGADVTHLEQGWAEPVRAEQIDRGQVGWRISDLEGRFNLAWLQIEAAEEDGQDQLPAEIRAAFERLALDRGLSQMQVRRLEQALVPRLGQRFSAYGRATRPPPLPLFALEELLLVNEIDREALRRLRPVVATLPDGAGGLNLNTVSADVLAALLLRQSRSALEAQLAAARPFPDIDTALGWVNQRAGAERVQLLEELTPAVGSSWFEARIDAQLDGIRLTRRVVLKRTGAEECCLIQSVLPELQQ